MSGAMTVSVRTLSRVASGGVALVSGGGLLLAGWLEPAVQGHSTHTQLGFDGCTVLTLSGWPCPMCGMTTTFALMADGRVLQALHTQPFGVVLFTGLVATFAIAVAELVWPTDRWRRLWARIAPVEGWLALLFLAGLGVGWVWKIAVMRGWLG